MKRTVYVAAGMLVLGLAIACTTQLSAQTSAPQSPTTQGSKAKTAMFNLTYVLKNYEKFKTFEAELKTAVGAFQTKDTELKKMGEELLKQGQAASPEVKEGIDRKLKDLQRQIEDNKMEGSKVLAKKQEEQLKILYMDVRSVAARFAAAHGYEAVLHYNDAVTEADYNSGANIARKLQAGALMPIYMANGVDISREITITLNSGFQKPR